MNLDQGCECESNVLRDGTWSPWQRCGGLEAESGEQTRDPIISLSC
jgi:hypothetical protein